MELEEEEERRSNQCGSSYYERKNEPTTDDGGSRVIGERKNKKIKKAQIFHLIFFSFIKIYFLI